MPKVKSVRENDRFEVYNSLLNYFKEEEMSTPEVPLGSVASSISNESSTTNSSVPNASSAPNSSPGLIFTTNDLVKDAQRIGEFRGDGNYALTSFLREVETTLPLFNGNPQLKQYVYQRIIINKIQGPALDAIRTLGSEATWEEIKSELVKGFGVQESYHQLYHKALSARNFQVREYYITLKNILNKLNEKYEYDLEKPSEFHPKMNETLILRTFLNNIDPNLASIIFNRNIKSLREAFNLLENLGMIREKSRVNNSVNHKTNNQNRSQFNSRQNNNYRQNLRQWQQSSMNEQGQNNNYNNRQSNNYSNRQNHNYYNSGQSRQTSLTNRGQFRQYNSNNNERSGQNLPNNFSNNTSRQNNSTRLEPMDVDHIQQQEEVNFHLIPHKFTYQ